MSDLQIQDNLNWLLLRVSFSAKQGLIKLSEEYGLTVMQAFTLCLLAPKQPVPMHSLSGMLGCDASNVTGIVDRLVRSSYIERKESSIDRRVHIISLTKKGYDVRAEFLQKITEKDLPSLKGLTQQEINTLKRLLVKALIDFPYDK